MTTSIFNIERLRSIAIVLALWVIALLLIHPRGNFPLMDDWIYAYGARSLAEHGVFRFSPYMEATGISQILWGALFAKIGGFSFDVLRVSTLVLSAAGIVAVWLTALELGASSAIAGLAAAAFAFNPIALTLSATFMTDVPFAAWSALACLFFVKALAEPRGSAIWLAVLFAMAATMVRQQGLAWSAAFAVAALFAWPRSRRNIIAACVPLIVTAVVLTAYMHWATTTGRHPADRDIHLGELAALLARGWHQHWLIFLKTALNVGFHLSWYVLPLVVWGNRRFERARMARWWWVAAVVAIVLVTGKVAPWGSSVLYDLGIGPVNLRDGTENIVRTIPLAPRAVWMLWTIGAALGGTALIVRAATTLWARVHERPSRDPMTTGRVIFAACAILIFITPMILVGFYDRYLVSCIPVAVVLCYLTAPSPARRSRLAFGGAALLLVVYAVFGVTAAHDYFEWNRARWATIERLEHLGRYRPEDIDGGMEYAGIHGFHRTGQYIDLPDAVVILSLENLPEFVVCGRVPYQRWLPPERDALWILAVSQASCPDK